jgi:hypothetical protein
VTVQWAQANLREHNYETVSRRSQRWTFGACERPTPSVTPQSLIFSNMAHETSTLVWQRFASPITAGPLCISASADGSLVYVQTELAPTPMRRMTGGLCLLAQQNQVRSHQSFVAKRNHGIDTGCASGWNECRSQC